MQEALYAGSEVITGDWLPYDVLANEGVRFHLINDFSELPETVSRVYYNGKSNPNSNSKIKRIRKEESLINYHSLKNFRNEK